MGISVPQYIYEYRNLGVPEPGEEGFISQPNIPDDCMFGSCHYELVSAAPTKYSDTLLTWRRVKH